jgi:hypothetical protein
LRLATPLLHPWIHHSLPAEARQELPGRIGGLLEDSRRATAILHLRRKHELGRILEEFAREGIVSVVLKGMALACLVYPEPSLRPMIDIDLAVPEAQWPRARQVLLGLGLCVPSRHAGRPQTGPNAMAETSKPFQRPGTRMMVDLHPSVDLGSRGSVTEESRLVGLSREVDLDGLQARVLTWENFIVHVGAHLSERHLFDRGLPALLDLTLILHAEGGSLDWQRVLDAGPQGDPRAVGLPLLLAAELLGAPVPAAPLEAMRAASDDAELHDLAIEQIFGAGENRVSPGLIEMATRSPGRRLAHVVRRLNPWRSAEAGAGFGHAGRLAARRLGSDLIARAKIYASAWRRGDLTRENLRHALRLRQGRERIAELMELELPDGAERSDPISRRPGAGGG